MHLDPTLVLAILMAFAFALTNGFHDAANSIATIVATRVARPLPAVAMASVFNLVGPLVFGAAVANTVGKLVSVDPAHTVPVIGAGLTGAVLWNTFTWRRNLPSSSSHALVGGLVGAALLESGPDSINLGPVSHGQLSGVLGVLVGMLVATILGFVVAFVLSRLALRATRRASTRLHRPVASAQWVASAWLAFSHGSNDAQKTIGIIAGLLVASGNATTLTAPLPVVLGAAIALTLGHGARRLGHHQDRRPSDLPDPEPRRSRQPDGVRGRHLRRLDRRGAGEHHAGRLELDRGDRRRPVALASRELGGGPPDRLRVGHDDAGGRAHRRPRPTDLEGAAGRMNRCRAR